MQPPHGRPRYGLLRVQLDEGELPVVLAAVSLYVAGNVGLVLYGFGGAQAEEMAEPLARFCQMLGVVPLGIPSSKGEKATLDALGFDKPLQAVTR